MVEFAPPAGGAKHTSYAEIKKLKKNMQKVPIIKEKSDAYHQKEILEAEIAFEQAQKKIINKDQKKVIKEKINNGEKNIPKKRRQRRRKKVIKKRIKKNKI